MNHFVANALVVGTLIAVSASGAWGQSTGPVFPPITGQANRPEVNIDQTMLGNGPGQGAYPFRKIQESGRHFFSMPFTKEDGFGEGPNGPRMKQLRKQLNGLEVCDNPSSCTTKKVVHFNFPLPIPNIDGAGASFLRLNGLDSQSCFECHNSIGERHLTDTNSAAFARKVGVGGGPAGFASTAFINPAFEDPVGCNIDDKWVNRASQCHNPNDPAEATEATTLRYFMHIRNPPHVFGTGYAQKIAEEMTAELQDEYIKGIGKFVVNKRETEVSLESKGVGFGKLVLKPKPQAVSSLTATNVIDEHLLGLCSGEKSSLFDVDDSGLDGVSCDLIVRPFQWKGIAQSERNFVRDALNFHFGIESHEGRECDPSASPAPNDAPCIRIGNSNSGIRDIDRDGMTDEMSYGNVTALTIFTMSLRPPVQNIPKGASERSLVERGSMLFKGAGLPGGQLDKAACSSCHRPSMSLESTLVTVRTPGPQTSSRFVGNGIGLGVPNRAETLPAVQHLRQFLENIQPRGGAPRDLASTAMRNQLMAMQPPGYTFDLQMKDFDAMPLSFPRLAEGNKAECGNPAALCVPLFSDLKRHHMGSGLCTSHPQSTDNGEIKAVAGDVFLTRPLWGVADTGPWLHDGRATSLQDAILLHAAASGPGQECHTADGNAPPESEAKAAVEHFMQLPLDDKKAVIAFLETLQLPLDPRYTFDQPPQ